MAENTLQQVVVVLKDPVLEENSLTYTIEVLNGDMPGSGNNISMFIDIIGMPLTPISYAGVARRAYPSTSSGPGFYLLNKPQHPKI